MVLEVIKIIKQFKAEGTTILLVEQNLVMELADYMYILIKGPLFLQVPMIN
jgi:ABC-type branched-subunit amino acid transport system ATPase component